MENKKHKIESNKSFSKSLVWNLNKSYYQSAGLDAWTTDGVPHQLTSNAMVGKTYAFLIFAYLKDLCTQGFTDKTIYILEMGAGHGRLAYHIMIHLKRLISSSKLNIPPYCYIISDIAESNLQFFSTHRQFQPFIEEGIMDICYFDGTLSTSLSLRHSDKTIAPGSLDQPLIAIGNYFFDSLPNDLFKVDSPKIEEMHVSLSSSKDPKQMNEHALLKNIELEFSAYSLESGKYPEPKLNALLENYRKKLHHTHVYLPTAGFYCIENLKKLSRSGLMIIALDKGYHKMHELENAGDPEIIKHASFSIWVNFHALDQLFKDKGSSSFFPKTSPESVYLACFNYSKSGVYPSELSASYSQLVEDFGPSDFNILKKFSYQYINSMSIFDIISMLRLSAYDSEYFQNLLPRIKQVYKEITVNERNSLVETLMQIWKAYFNIGEDFDVAFEIAGILYDLGTYENALELFTYSNKFHGPKADVYYNMILCCYQLRKDSLFNSILKEAKKTFPGNESFIYLEKLDMKA